MDQITLDFETFYATEEGYSLKRMPTEDYVADDRFEIIGVGAWINDRPYGWMTGTLGQTVDWLRKLDLPSKVLVGHHLMFDGLILQARCGIVPAYYACTESMCRPFLKPILRSLSLGSVSHYLGLGEKGLEVVLADGKRRADFTPEELRTYLEDYCLNGDCRLTRGVYNWARPQLTATEMRLIDMTLRMYCEPMFQLDATVYEKGLLDVQKRKAQILAEMELQGITGDVLRSSQKFAKLLEERGVEVPMKVSPTWLKKPPAEQDPDKKMTYAFGKADPEFIKLREEYADDLPITMLLNARVSEKGTMEEKRNAGLLDVARRYTKFRIDVSYYAAHTGRYTSKEQDAAK